MNVYDTERMLDVMAPHGYEMTEAPDDADVVVLNPCHIREKAADKVYSDIGRIRQIKKARPETREEMVVAVAGCVAQAEGDEIMRRAPVVDMVFGPQAYHRLPDMVKAAKQKHDKGESVRLLDTDFAVDEKFEALDAGPRQQSAAAFLTVQEGCDKFCSFCVVPYTRGAEYSRSVSKVLEEAERLVAQGVVEVTLLGQNVNAYHGETATGESWDLARLIEALADIRGLERIRYTTSHPRDMTDALINAHRDVDKLMPYLHLPVQAGSDRILKEMNRHHTAASYRDIIDRLRAVCPDIAISGDFIVGFPGESDAEFAETLQLVRDVGYAQAYSFKYSPRPGTPAATMASQVDEEVKAARLALLQDELNSQQLAFNTRTVGQVMAVLLERYGKQPGQLVGRSPYMQAIHVDTEDAGLAQTYFGKIVNVEVTSAAPHSIKGRIVQSSNV